MARGHRLKRKVEDGSVPLRHRRGTRVLRWYCHLFTLALVIWGVYQANRLEWSCDDIFITLRYADNFLAGKGFVYNECEYVEGYTHFLWLAILTLCQWVGLDPLEASMALGLTFYAGVILLFSVISYKLNRRKTGIFIPFTGLVLAIHFDFQVWATSGMETMFFTFLLSLAFFIYFFSGIRDLTKLAATGLVLILAVLTRPDGALIFILANVCLLTTSILHRSNARQMILRALIFNLAFLCVYLPYFIWKLNYYGAVFPNSYYAKSGNLAHFDQGFFYLWMYLRAYLTSALLLLGIPVVIRQLAVLRRRIDGGYIARLRKLLEDNLWKTLVVVLLGVALYGILFVARVGGDFMYARFIVPMVPFITFVAEMSIIDLLGRKRRLTVLVFAAVALSVGLAERWNRDRLLLTEKDGKVTTVSHRGIIDERYYYKYVSSPALEETFGREMERHFRGLDATVLLVGQARLGYYGRFKTCIERYGLTDRYIAHLPLETRSRVGHEKEAPYDYLVERGTDFVFGREVLRPEEYRSVFFNLPAVKVRGELITYDRNLIKTLKKRLGTAFSYTDFEEVLDRYIAVVLPTRTSGEILTDYHDIRQFYFLHNDDVERESVFQKALAEHHQLKLDPDPN